MPHDDAKLQAARDELAERCPKNGTLWRHKKTGGVYRAWFGCVIEATLQSAVTYWEGDLDTPYTVWVRPLAEFLEKFEPAAGGK